MVWSIRWGGRGESLGSVPSRGDGRGPGGLWLRGLWPVGRGRLVTAG